MRSEVTSALLGPLPPGFETMRVAPYTPRQKRPGRGGMNAPSVPVSPPSRRSPPQVDITTIQHNWTLTSHGQYIFCTASLDRILAPQGLICKDNDGQGNCLWHSLLDAGLERAEFPTYASVKQFVAEFAQHHSDQLQDHIAAFCQIPQRHQ